jgi:hypothetical protein
MRKQPWFYLFVFGLALLLAVYTRLTMAERAEDFYLFPDAPLWLFLEALLAVHLLDRLHRRASRRGRASGRAGYYFGLLGWGALLFVGLGQLLQLALLLTHLGQGDYGSWYEVARGLATLLLLYLLVGGVYLPFLYQQHAGQVRLALEQAEKAATQARLRALQQHVDPHFLFNNLNILSALIEPSNEAALDYLTHLASLYRYLVRATQREAVPVAEELAFARDYQFLLRRRFGAAYAFEEDVQLSEAEQLTQLVPPGALQELLTNAVKHNLASRQQPLLISLSIMPAGLRLAHPRRPRPAPTEGTGSGLPGLRARLALLTDRPLVVEESDAYFAVTVPLLAALPTPAAHAPAAA